LGAGKSLISSTIWFDFTTFYEYLIQEFGEVVNYVRLHIVPVSLHFISRMCHAKVRMQFGDILYHQELIYHVGTNTMLARREGLVE